MQSDILPFYSFTKEAKIQQNGNRVCAYDKVIETPKLVHYL